MKRYFFLSGIARSGSTLLGSILNQNPDVYVSPTSPLMDFFFLTEQTLNGFNAQYTYDYSTISKNIHQSIMPTFYKHVDKKYIIDKHRGWPKNINTIKGIITPNPRIICTYRPACENVCSFLKLIRNDPNNIIDKFLKSRNMEINTYNRAMHIWHDYSMDPYESLRMGLETDRNSMHIVNYHDLVKDPKNEIDKIYDFLDIPHYENHVFKNIQNTCSERKDEAWGFKGLHDIRSDMTVTSDNPREILGDKLMEYFSQYDQALKM